MIVEYIRYEISPTQHDQFIAAYRAAAEALDVSEHCRSYEISQGIEEQNNFIVRIGWDSVEGHEKGFRTSPQFMSFFAKVKPFFEQIREMKHYRIVQTGKGTTE